MDCKKKLILLLMIVSLPIFAQPSPSNFSIKRDANTLLNQYYHTKDSDPIAAKLALDLLLESYPNNITGLKEMGYWYLRKQDPASALPYFIRAYKLETNNYELALQIGYLYTQLKQYPQALEYITAAQNSSDLTLKQKATAALQELPTSLTKITPAPAIPIPVPTLTQPIIATQTAAPSSINVVNPMDQYYGLQRTDPAKAEKLLAQIVKDEPDNAQAWAEWGYLNLKKNDLKLALDAFLKSYALKKDAKIANQISFLQTSPQNKTTNVLDEFYQLQHSQPKKAAELLREIVKNNPENVQALKQWGYLNLNKGDKKTALDAFLKAYSLEEDPELAAQIGYLYVDLNDKKMAIIYFTAAAKSNDLKIRNKSLLALKELQKPVAKVTIATKTIPANLTDSELNQFYQIKDINPEKAKLILLKILTREPDNVTALKELGYLYLQENDNENAYAVFKQVYAITHDYPIAAQLGYIADKLNYQHQAYKYFATASHTSDPKLKLISNNAMTNLAGWNTRFLPDPYFIDYYFSPLYFSRFDLGIFPLNARIGVYLDQHHQVELYGGMRATRDDRTSGSAISPQIYEDNVAVFSIGSRYQPFRRIPVSFYGEIGRGYDLIYRFRDRWRSDIRGGLLSGAIWGKKTYSDGFSFPFKPVGDFYSDITYYSRYTGDIIGTARIRQGFRLVTHHSSYLDAYLRVQGLADTEQQYYNNTLEIGPGIVFVPTNRYNIAFRYEKSAGYYLPVNSPSVNPYGSHYHNTVVMLEIYMRF